MALSKADKEYLENHLDDEIEDLVEATGGTVRSIKTYITKYKKTLPEEVEVEERSKKPSAIDKFITTAEQGRKGVVVMTPPAGQSADETRKKYPKPSLPHVRKIKSK